MPLLNNQSPAISILFLDFDGVLQTPAVENWQEMEHTGELAAVLSCLPHLKIVVTSTHREGKSLAELRQMLPQPIASRVIGATAVTAQGRANGGRQAEIELWLSNQPNVTSWVAVDDEAHLYQKSCKQLVLTHKWLGWTEQTTHDVLEKLRVGQTSTGIVAAPRLASAVHRCLPSMNSMSSPCLTNTGSAGQSGRRPSAQSSNWPST